MKASALIDALRAAIDEHGDLDVYGAQRMEGTWRIEGVNFVTKETQKGFNDVAEPHFEMDER